MPERCLRSFGSISSLFGEGRSFVKLAKSIGEWGGSSNGRAACCFSATMDVRLFPAPRQSPWKSQRGPLPGQAANLALRAAAPPLGMGRACSTIVGDRPTREIPWNREGCLVPGWIRHEETMQHLGAADALV